MTFLKKKNKGEREMKLADHVLPRNSKKTFLSAVLGQGERLYQTLDTNTLLFHVQLLCIMRIIFFENKRTFLPTQTHKTIKNTDVEVVLSRYAVPFHFLCTSLNKLCNI